MNQTLPTSIPEPRNLTVSDQEWLRTLYSQLGEHDWQLEFRMLEDRCDGVKGPALSVHFYREEQEILGHLQEHRQLAAQQARQLQDSGAGPWPAGLFYGVQPRRTARGRREDVAAFVVLTCDLDFKDWPELAQEKRPRAVWERLHTSAPSPSAVTWTGHGFHAYWLLREPLLDKRRGEEIQKAMALGLRGDQTWDCPRLLRWPNSVNYKRVLQGQCHNVRVVWWSPELRYDPSELASCFRKVAKLAPASPSKGDRFLWEQFIGHLNREKPALKALWEGRPCGLPTHDRSALDMTLANFMARHQFHAEAFTTIATAAPWNTEKTLTTAYLDRTWNKAQQGGAVQPTTLLEAGKKQSTTDTVVQPPEHNEFLHSLPESAWPKWARDYREAVGPSTEAADELHYVALLTVLGAALGRNVTVSSGRFVYPNVYAMLIGPTGDRKTTAAELALDLLRRVAPEVLLLNGVGSQEGLMERMADRTSSKTLLFADEMAALLKKGRRESSGSLIEFITELFNCPESKSHFTRSKSISLEKPTLSILGASTPAWLEAALEEEDILGGFTNRFIYVSGIPKPDNPLPPAPDASKLQSLCEWIRKITRGPQRVMTLGSDVQELWSDFYVQWRRFVAGQTERGAALLRRIDLYILKFACIHAAMDETTEITGAHLLPAIALGRFLAGCSYRILGDLGSPRDYRLERLIEQKLQAAQGVMRRKNLRQLLGGRITGEKLDRILRAMESNGLICQTDDNSGRGSSRVVKLTPQD